MNTKVKCILLDDELPGLTYLRMLCEQIPAADVVKVFNDPLKLVQEAEHLDFDVCVLDIDMPGLNGLEVARLLRKKPVIFTTAHTDYAAEAFDLEAVDYIRKPIARERLEKAIQKAAQQLEKSAPEKQFIQWNSNKGKTLLFFDQILRITTTEGDKRDKLALLENGERLVLKNISFAQLLEALPADRFCRVNKKDIVALKTVKFFSHDELVLAMAGKEERIPFSENFKKEFLEKTGY